MQSPHFLRHRFNASGLVLVTAIVFAHHSTDAQIQPSSSSPPAPPINLPLQPDASATGTPSTPPSPPTRETPSAAVESSVVKIFSTFRGPDFYKPWEKAAPTEGGGSGVVIEGKRILTNAHVVIDASEIQI